MNDRAKNQLDIFRDIYKTLWFRLHARTRIPSEIQILWKNFASQKREKRNKQACSISLRYYALQILSHHYLKTNISVPTFGSRPYCWSTSRPCMTAIELAYECTTPQDRTRDTRHMSQLENILYILTWQDKSTWWTHLALPAGHLATKPTTTTTTHTQSVPPFNSNTRA
jgi:hypothetical protein